MMRGPGRAHSIGAAMTVAITIGGLAAAAPAGAAARGTTVLVSVSSTGVRGNFKSGYDGPRIRANGRYVAFSSYATTLVPGDNNFWYDVFLRDVRTGRTRLVSRASTGAQGNNDSQHPSISADGRYVAFDSYADNLVPGDTNRSAADVFVRDMLTGSIQLVSRNTAGAQGNDYSEQPSLSADGRYVAFSSFATNLTPGDTNDEADIYVRDLLTGRTQLASRSSAGVEGDDYSSDPSISADGRYVAFFSYSGNLVANDTNYKPDAFVRDMLTGRTQLVSVSSTGRAGNHPGYGGVISANGRYVAFFSYATNLVPGDVNGKRDVFVRDLLTGRTSLASRSTTGAEGNRFSFYPSISADGRYVAFSSAASNLVPDDTNGATDVFLRDLLG